MKVINLTNIGADFLNVKAQIEKELINDNKIDGEKNFNDFITLLNPSKYIYLKDEHVIPFNIFNEKYLITAVTDEEENILISILEKIKYDISSLTEIQQEELIKDNSLTNESFVINSKYFKFENA